MEKILIIQTAFIGDAVLTLPMIEKLKEMFPTSIIDVVCIELTAEIFEFSPFINKVFVFEKRGKHSSFRGLRLFARELKDRNYDGIYSPHRSFRTSLLVMLSGVRETYGFSNADLKYIYKNSIEYHFKKHEIKRNLDLIGFNYSDENWKIIPKIIIPPDVILKVNNYFLSNKINKDFVALNPGSVWATKRYPVEYLNKIVDFILENNKQVVLIGGNNDKEITYFIKKKYEDNVFDTAGLFSLIESIQLLKHSSLLITNDSAPTHLGMCADIKVLTLYCSTVPEFGFYPYNNLSRYLSYDELYCKPCGIHGFNECPLKNFDCGVQLKPGLVIKNIKEMIF
ncbi:MAG: glycosyltransferase family 9 protein [Ignavibacteriaceae bacterium]